MLYFLNHNKGYPLKQPPSLGQFMQEIEEEIQNDYKELLKRYSEFLEKIGFEKQSKRIKDELKNDTDS